MTHNQQPWAMASFFGHWLVRWTFASAVTVASLGCNTAGQRIPVGSRWQGGDVTYAIGATLGPAWIEADNKNLDDGLGGEMFAMLDVVSNGRVGGGVRGGYQWQWAGRSTKYNGGYVVALAQFRPFERLHLYGGAGPVFNATLTSSRVVGVTAKSKGRTIVTHEGPIGLRVQGGIRLMAIKFSDVTTWQPFVEFAHTRTSGDVGGNFTADTITFGAIFTAPVVYVTR
jgi:hypothetical protein